MEEQAENMSGQEKENLAGQVMDSVGMPPEESAKAENSEAEVNEDPHGIKKRLGMQAKKHQREMRMMQEQLQQLQSQLVSKPAEHQPTESYTGQPQGQNVNDQISMAVAAALRAKDEHEAKMAQEKAAKERAEHMQKQYQDLSDSFDKASDKYEDFDDVVRSPKAPFTEAMRDYALTLPNSAEVLYKLGKDPAKLAEVSKLKPIDQAREMYKLSVALMGVNEKPEVQARPMGQIKGNPVASHAVTEKTPVGDLRARMKSGNWK